MIDRPVASRGCPFGFDTVGAQLGLLPGREAMRVCSESATLDEYDGDHRYRAELAQLEWHQTEFAEWRKRLH